MSGRELLERFRPIEAPGGVGPVGVPSDAEDGVDAELAPVFAALAPVLEACDQLRADAERRAAELRAGSEREVAQLLARAQLDAAELRAASAARRREQGEDEGRQLLADARADADRIEAAAAERIPELVTQVLRRLREQLGMAAE